MTVIRVERLTQADLQDMQASRDRLSFDVRELRREEWGTVVRVRSRTCYDVLVPGRAYPWEAVPTVATRRPKKLAVGERVLLMFLGPGLPVIMAPGDKTERRRFLGPEDIMIVLEWTRDRSGPGRTSWAPWTKPRTPLVRCARMSGTFGEFPEVRVWDGQIFFTVSTRTIGRLSMGEAFNPWYASGAPVMPHYTLVPAPGLGSSRNGWALDRNGDFCFLWTSGASKASRGDLATLWQTPIALSGHYILPGTIYVVPPTSFEQGEIGGLSVAAGELHAIRWQSDSGAELARTPLEQTAAGDDTFDDDEPALFLSGGHYDGGPWIPDTHLRYWDPNVPLARSFPANPFGFLNGAPFLSVDYWSHIGERRFGTSESSMGAADAYWGPGPESSNELLQFVQLAGALQHDDLSREKSRLIPMPKASHYLPTLVAYTATGAKAWEVLGWESTPPVPPYHYRNFYSPRMLHDGKIYSMTLRLTFETIDEEWVKIKRVYGEGEVDGELPSGGIYNPSWVLTTAKYEIEEMLPRRSRWIVGIETLFEVYSVDTGARLASSPFVPQVTSKFVSRGEYKGELPPEHGVRLDVSSVPPWITDAEREAWRDAYIDVMGYDTADYWPPHSTYFARLAAGDYFAYGLYSGGSNRVPPVWLTPSAPYAEGKRERDIDQLEGDQYYDPLNNQAYNRPISPPDYLFDPDGSPAPIFNVWGARGDQNNNGTPEDLDLPPPSAYLYDPVWHETHYDLPHVSDYAEPIRNTAGNLLIFPPLYPLGLSLTLPGKKFEFAPGSNAYYSWSGGNLANRQNHNLTLQHANWKTADRQVWEARDWSGSIVWTHTIERSEFGAVFSHEWARPACGDGELHIVYRINGGKPRLRRVNDANGVLISDIELDATSTPGDTGGIPHEVVLAGDVAVFTTREHWDLDEETWEFGIVGQPYVYGLYPEEEEQP